MSNFDVVVSHGATIPSIGYGTWTLKGEACAEAVDWAIKSGYRHIDTAKMYDNEEGVGQGIKAAKIARHELFVTTKVWHADIGPGDLQRSAEASLKRLGLDQVDLLLIHWPNAGIPLKGSIEALCEAKDRGLTRHIGVSNFPTQMLFDAIALASHPIVTNQCEYHPHLAQPKLLEACAKHGVSFTSYCPLGRGAVGGVIDEPVVKAIAARLKRTPAQVVLRWHVQQGLVAIPRSSNKQRIAENVAVYDFALAADDMAALSKLARPDGRVVNLAHAPKWD